MPWFFADEKIIIAGQFSAAANQAQALAGGAKFQVKILSRG
jgi:hypothetical protein